MANGMVATNAKGKSLKTGQENYKGTLLIPANGILR